MKISHACYILSLLPLAICSDVLAETVFDNLNEPLADFGGFYNDTDQIKSGQPFVLGDNHRVNAATLKLTRTGDADGAISVQVWDDNAGLPGASLGTLGTVTAMDIAAEPTDYTFSSPISGLTPNEPHYIVLSTAGTNWNNDKNVVWETTTSDVGRNGAERQVFISVSTMQWHPFDADFPEGGPSFPVYFSTSINTVPEPSTATLFCFAFGCLTAWRRI